MPTFAQKKGLIKNNNNTDPCYDAKLDRKIIEASFSATYGILPSEQRKIKHADYEIMLAGIGPDTPLVRLVQIRKEKTIKQLETMSEYEKNEYFRWQSFKNNMTPLKNRQKAIDDAFRSLF